MNEIESCKNEQYLNEYGDSFDIPIGFLKFEMIYINIRIFKNLKKKFGPNVAGITAHEWRQNRFIVIVVTGF